MDILNNFRTGHWYDTKKLMQVLDRFTESEEGQHARVVMLLPEGRNPMQKEFNIKEISKDEFLNDDFKTSSGSGCLCWFKNGVR